MTINMKEKWEVAAGLMMTMGVFVCANAGIKENEPPAAPLLSASVTAPARALSSAFEAVAAQVGPAVVSVFSEKTVTMNSEEVPLPLGGELFRFFLGQQPQPPSGRHQGHEYKIPQISMGSGVILNKQGYILTNFHVVNEMDKLKIQLADKREYEAEEVAADAKSDVAVILIKGIIPDNLPTVQLGDSDAMKVGDWVLAIGAPFGLTQTVTAGIISAKGRDDVGIADYEDFLQTDAAINPGNSGGPLVSMEGEVIGLNSAIATGLGQFAGVGFAIPINMIKAYLPTLLKGGAISRGYLGANIQDLNETLAKQFQIPSTQGALVSQANRDTPAEKAGLASGDVIVGYQGKPIQNTRELRRLVAATTPDTTVELTVIRNGKDKAIRLRVGKLSTPEVTATEKHAPPPPPADLGKFGLSVQPLTGDLATQLGYDDPHGLLINDVDPGSPAALAGLQAGDLIVETNHQPVATLDALRKALGKSQETVLLLVKRKDTSQFVTLNAG